MSLAIAKEGNAMGATLLITGCCLGAGMIGLPVVSAIAGFIPTTLAMVVCYLFATGSGLLILEAVLWFDQRVNLLSMAEFALGKSGKAVTYSLFLFLFYCLFIAYMDGGGRLIAHMLSHLFFMPVSRELGIFLCAGFVGAIVYAGTTVVSAVSRLFLFILAFSYCALLAFGFPYVQGEKLLYANLKEALVPIPVLLVCFGYQNLIPTLTYYVGRNINALRTAIFVGNLIPFLIYFLWNFVILGILPDAGSIPISEANTMVTDLLERASESGSVLIFANVFSLFAILTPFMANTMAFVDFLKDGLKTSSELVVYALIFVPPALLTLFYPHLFLKALGLVGGCADVLLFGVLPVFIVWIGRYVKQIKGSYRVPGGKLFLIAILLLSAGFLLIRS